MLLHFDCQDVRQLVEDLGARVGLQIGITIARGGLGTSSLIVDAGVSEALVEEGGGAGEGI